MKQIPNIITSSRIILSFIILFVDIHSISFIFTYLLCGLTDVLDGLIARKYLLQSKCGARLDSFADFIFFTIVMIKLALNIRISYYIVLWIILIFCIRISSLIIVKIKFHFFAILHTQLNKLTGLILFLFPIIYRIVEIEVLLKIICIIATFSSVEEMIIHLSTKKIILNRKSFWDKDKEE